MRVTSRYRFDTTMACVAALFSYAVALHAGLMPPPGAAQTQFQHRLRAIASRFGGQVTLAGVDLKTGERFGLAANRPVRTASIIKLPVMVEAFYQTNQGKLRWSQPVTVTAWDRVPGSGILQFLSSKMCLTLGDAITLMIDLSDNAAANIVIHQIGIPAVNARMRQLGLMHTSLLGYVFHPTQPETAAEKRFGLGETTANDMARLLTLIQQHRILTPALCDRMLQILSQQQDNDAFPRYTDRFPGVTWAHKTGALDDVRNDVGVAETPAGPIVLAGFAYDSPDRQWTADNAALLVLARLAQAVLEHFLPATAGAKPAK
ncbi:MAG TPA: serine hydrolase [Terriglobia bacterium]|nr:serine hydrolase [Terriglobia bacterium]